MKKIYVGIDLGTTYSAVAYFNKDTNQVEILKNSLDKDTTPSVIYLEGKSVIIGEEAKQAQKDGNSNTAAFYKSMMGDDSYTVYINGKDYTAEELSGLYLKALKEDIESANDVQIIGAVITCPAYFNEKQRQATINAGNKAGLKVLKIINEPTSAIISYGLTGQGNKNVMVYDLGGGTFDVTIAKVEGTNVKVISTNGNHQLGGKDWDSVLINEVSERFYDEFEIEIQQYPEAFKELQVKCEDLKKKLSNMAQATISISCEGYTGRYEITREFFDDNTRNYLDETMLLVNKCFDEIGGGFGWNSLDEVVLVGGSTRMPQVKDAIVSEYGKQPITRNINVDTIVASGAAMQAELCTNMSLTFKKVEQTPQGNKVISLTINANDISDITAHSLGMLALAKDSKDDYINSIILPKGTEFNKPETKDYEFRGSELEVYVLQGEDTDPYNTELLYKYIVTGMDSSKKTPISVSFSYGSNGTVEVSACNKDTKKELKVTKQTVAEEIGYVISRLKERKVTKVQDTEVLIFIDSSGSMDDGMVKSAQKAAIDFVEAVPLDAMMITIVEFASSSRPNCTQSRNKQEIISAIKKIKPGNVGWGTAAPIKKNINLFSSNDTQKIIIVLTDGYWETPDVDEAACQKLKKDGVIIYAIGIGGADEKFLARIASEKSGKKIDISKLSKTFVEIASSIATEI